MSDTFRKKYNSCHKLHEYSLEIKSIAEQLELKFKEIGQSREISLAMTNLEQSIMWATKALYTFKDENVGAQEVQAADIVDKDNLEKIYIGLRKT